MIVVFFFFKQKTAYEMRISDWSSDVCSSDLFGMDDDRARFACVLAEQGGLDGRPWRMRLRSPCRSQGTGQVGEGNGPRNRSQHNPSASSLCRAPRPVMTTSGEADRKSTRLNSSH